MAVNKRIRRVTNGSLDILHPQTVRANIKQDISGTPRSTFSTNLFDLVPDVGGAKFLKVSTGGAISKVDKPSDFNSIEEVHTHVMTDVTYIRSGTWVKYTGPETPTGIPVVTHFTIIDDDTAIEYLNSNYSGYRLDEDTYTSLPPGSFVRVNYTADGGGQKTMYAEATYEVLTLQAYLNDTTSGKVPIVGGKIDKQYFPEYTKGHMRYKGGADLSAGSSEASAVNVSTLFTALATNPDEQLGDFFIVTKAGYIIADGKPDGTGFIHANAEGPVYLNVGDRIVFVAYTMSPAVSYTFAFLHNDYSIATVTRKGPVQLSSKTSTDRGKLKTASSGVDVMDEAALRGAMRDVIYSGNMAAVPLSAGYAKPKFRVYTTSQPGQPTNTEVGMVELITFSGGLTQADEGIVILLSNGRMYRLQTWSVSDKHSWEHLGTASVPVMVEGMFLRNANKDDAFYIASYVSTGIYDCVVTDFVDGDLLFV